jgi:hypothetical protein
MCSAIPPSNCHQARDRDRTGDLTLTKGVLYRLSYASDAVSVLPPDLIARTVLQFGLQSGKRETGLEPATTSLEGLRSTN